MLSKHAYILLILAGALTARVAFVSIKPVKTIEKDALHYDDIAVNLLNGNGFSLSDKNLLPGDRTPGGGPRPTARRPILYPLMLSGIYAVFGRNFLAVGIIQAVIGTITCLFIYIISLSAFEERRQALFSALFSALYLPFIRFTGAVITETLFLLLIVLSFYFMHRALMERGIGWKIGAGILAGASFLCRPTAVGLPLIFAGMLVWRERKLRRKAAAGIAIYSTAFLLLYIPWVARNYYVFDAFVPGFTSSGYNLFLGSYPPARAKPNIPLEAHPDYLKRRLEGKGEIESNRIFTEAALENIRNHPLGYARLIVVKLVAGWFNIRSDSVWVPTARSAALNGTLILLAIAGAFWGCKRNRFNTVFILSPIFYFTIFHMLVVSSTRYNLPSYPFAIILASLALERFFQRVGFGTRKPQN